MFKNEGIMQGVCEYKDGKGKYWRRMDEGEHYSFYKISEDGDAYIFEGAISKPSKKKNIKEIHEEFTNRDQW